MAKQRKDLAWLIQVFEEYGTKKIRAQVVIPQTDGTMNFIDSSYWSGNDSREFAGLDVMCYLGDLEYAGTGERDRGKIWGLGHSFKLTEIDRADHARDIARMLTKIRAGLDKANAEMGYQKDDDFVGYLGRIGAAIGVTTFYVRNDKPFQNVDGQKWRTVDGGNLQYWIREVCKLAVSEPGTVSQMARGSF